MEQVVWGQIEVRQDRRAAEHSRDNGVHKPAVVGDQQRLQLAGHRQGRQQQPRPGIVLGKALMEGVDARFEARHLVQEISTLFKPELDRKGITLEAICPAHPVTFQADPALLEQVLINLVKNAADAVADRDNPTIQVKVQKLGPKSQIMVMDNGPGIPEEAMDQIFVPFFTTKKEGSGIGLSLSRQIMRMHKGNIEIHSVEREGTVVTLTL